MASKESIAALAFSFLRITYRPSNVEDDSEAELPEVTAFNLHYPSAKYVALVKSDWTWAEEEAELNLVGEDKDSRFFFYDIPEGALKISSIYQKDSRPPFPISHEFYPFSSIVNGEKVVKRVLRTREEADRALFIRDVNESALTEAEARYVALITADFMSTDLTLAVEQSVIIKVKSDIEEMEKVIRRVDFESNSEGRYPSSTNEAVYSIEYY